MNNTLMENETSSMAAVRKPLQFGGFLNAVTFYYISIVLQNFLNCSTSVMAFLAGIINISVFVQMDLKQGVNQSLLVLSCSDCVFGFMATIMKVFYFMSQNNLQFAGQVTTFFLIHSFRIAITLPLCVSLVVTTIIAVVRCLCVVMPMSFRNIVTNRRQLMAIAGFGCLVLIIPVLNLGGFLSSLHPTSLSKSPKGGALKISRAFFEIFINVHFFVCLCIMALCMGFLIHALKRFSKFKALATLQRCGENNNSSKFASREAQVIKTTITLLAIFIACNVSMCIQALMSQMMSNYSPAGRYRLEHEVGAIVVGIFGNLNASLNTLAYYFTNTAFQNVIKSRFAKCFKSCQ